MRSLLVAYDLNNEVRRPPIVDEIRKSPGYARLSESSYIISTDETVQQVYDRFNPLIDKDDDFFVVTVTRPWIGYSFRNVMDWLKSHVF